MEGVGLAPAGSLDAPGSPEAIVFSDRSLTLPPNGVRPTNERFACMERRSFERRVLSALRLRTSGSRPPLEPVIVHQMAEDFGVEITRNPQFWPYDPSELNLLLREIDFLEQDEQRFALQQPTDVLSHADQLPLLAAELVRQRAGIIGHLKRMGEGTSELFSRDSASFFEEGASNGVPEESDFAIERLEALGLGENPGDDAIKRAMVETRFPNRFFFRHIFADVGVSPARAQARADKGRAANARHPRSVLQVFRGGLPYNDGEEGC